MTALTISTFTKHRATFEAFLNERGAEILQPTNEWELLRFRTSAGTSVVYRNAKNSITPTGKAQEAWDSYREGKSWRGCTSGNGAVKQDVVRRAILARDGDACFYCRNKLNGDLSVEHLLSVTHGGSNHISNLVLAHVKCNSAAGHLSIMEKIRIRERE